MNRLDYRNTNTLWASVMVETLSRLGLTTAIICPGSRSTPLTVALVRHPTIETVPILDERSAAFFALGCAKRLHQPVAIVCTSGTAGANFYPAIIEAQESHVPLIIFTADRPPEMRSCASGQTIDQQKLFGSFISWYTEMAVPDVSRLSYARQTVMQGWRRALSPGPVHINCPFRDPLPPLEEPIDIQLVESEFFAAVSSPVCQQATVQPLPLQLWHQWTNTERGLIVAGPAQPHSPLDYCQAIAQLSKALGWPVIADGLSPLRNYHTVNPYLISIYDSLLRNHAVADQLTPELIIQLGPLPTSKVLRQWLQIHQPYTWQVTPHTSNVDALHGRTQVLETSVEDLGTLIASTKSIEKSSSQDSPSQYCRAWLKYEHHVSQRLARCLQAIQTPFEGKIAWILSRYLPENTSIFIANSMPIRDLESFWQLNDRHIWPYFSRGANGIDGTLSTAMGVAHGDQNTVLLTGDLAFLHDTNGLLNHRHLKGFLTVIVINNQGGGIFEMLPIAKFNPPFEEYFATPQTVNVSKLCAAYGIQHRLMQTWEELIGQINRLKTDNQPGLKVLEFCSDRKADAQWRKTQIAALVSDLKAP